MDQLYSSWNETCARIADNQEQSWKRDMNVYYMLEHVPGEYANVYLDLIFNKGGLTIQQVQAYCDLVDRVGNANRHDFNTTRGKLYSSTTCLRYLYHAHDILSSLGTAAPAAIEAPAVVEVGGGYGGLVVAINYLRQLRGDGPIDYTIVDLGDVQKLQRYYTSQFSLPLIRLSFVDAVTYGAEIDKPRIFVVSNYCLAEMGTVNRANYIDSLLSKPTVIGGYFQWNSDAPTDFLERFAVDAEEEHPKTGPSNKTIKFQSL